MSDVDSLAGALWFGRDVAPTDWRWRWESQKRAAEQGHSGDCTKPWSCALCHRDNAIKDATSVIAALATEGYCVGLPKSEIRPDATRAHANRNK